DPEKAEDEEKLTVADLEKLFLTLA
ncbi:transcriptional regulator, partial [Xanthomonas citri pv. citri]|nr:transcriptional regulator [Xanthomonas citri pv. citri]